jgi:hypothetical protein
MSTGILSAVVLFLTLLFEYTVISPFPSPWREIALPLIFGIVIMYRVSLYLGAIFLIAAGVISFARGLAGIDLTVAYLLSALLAVLLFNRVFARRSLIALSGFAFGTAGVFYLTKLVLNLGEDILSADGLSGTPVLHLFFAVLASVLAVIATSLLFTNARETFGRRFMQKDEAYEIQSRS